MLLDILGREVKRGDIISYTTNGFVMKYAKFVTPHLAVITNITTGRVRKDKDGNVTTVNMLKAVAYELHHSGAMMQHIKKYKNGKPVLRPIMSTTPLILDKSMLTGKYLESYNELCEVFNINAAGV